MLLGGGILIAVEGALNTWFRSGKLFPGPHLFAGAGIVVLWALAASLVPQMQKGNEGARNAHIALNAANLALFAWQVGGLLPRCGGSGWHLCTHAAFDGQTMMCMLSNTDESVCGCAAATHSCLTTQEMSS